MRNLNVNHQPYNQFIPAAKAKSFKTLSLASTAPKKDHVISLLKSISEDIEIALTHEIRKIVSDPQIQVEISDFSEDKPRKKGYVKAACCPENPDAKALMHVQSSAFGSLSELFFGGSPKEIKEKDLAKKPVTDTEKRLATRLLNVFIETIVVNFKKENIEWNQSWIDKLKAEEVLWTTVKIFSDDDWDFSLNLAWPYLISEDVQESVEVSGVDLSEALENALTKIPLTLKTVVAKSLINITDIANLKKGDILPISLPSHVLSKTGENTIVSGSICEHDQKLCLKIEQNHIGIKYE